MLNFFLKFIVVFGGKRKLHARSMSLDLRFIQSMSFNMCLLIFDMGQLDVFLYLSILMAFSMQ